MLFNTAQYLIFLLLVIVIYYILPSRVRYIWLLTASCYFYMQWNPKYILLLFWCAVIAYFGGLIIEKQKKNERPTTEAKQKLCLMICILINLLVLMYYKYFDFILGWINVILSHFRLDFINVGYDILLPVGISFYMLQSWGYLIDVYRGEVYPERNFFKFFLFVSFFPQLVAGPIERSNNLLVQLSSYHKFCFESFKKGVLMIVYGLFLKMVIADRAAIIVDVVFDNPEIYSGFYIVVAILLFSIQIYCDFYGYSIIAKGSALLMGIHLMDNFLAPYYARSIKEFWGRWHVSLSTWFRDYLYIPLGGNRKGVFRTEANRLIVFAISGLWHGASLGFVFWGGVHGTYQIIEDLFKRVRRVFISAWNGHMPEFLKYTEKNVTFSVRLFQRIRTILLVAFAWLFFRAGGFSLSLQIIKSMFSTNNWLILFDGSLCGLGVSRNSMCVLFFAIVVLFVIDYQKYKGCDVAAFVLRQGWIFQTLVVFGMIFTILLYGCYGKMYDINQFIYFQF